MSRAVVHGSVVLLASALLTGCSLSGLVFDLDGTGGAGSSASMGPGSSASTGSSMPGCMTTSSGSGGASGGHEVDCTNGIDDDGDGKADCLDPDCTSAGYSCHDVPTGWIGPIALYEGDPTQNPCCPGDYPTLGPVGGSGATAKPLTCSPCTCTDASVTCMPASLVSHTMADCSDVGTPVAQVNGMCQPVTGSYFSAAAPTAMVGSCTPAGGAPVTTPAPAFTTADRICAGGSQSKGCSATQVCARPAGGAFGGALCVYQPSAQATCPAGFPTKHSFFTDVDDTRACGACTCGSPAQNVCGATSTIYAMLNCNVNKKIADVPNDGSCASAPVAASFQTNVTTMSGSCPPMTASPTGDVTGAAGSEVTVCCTP